MQTALTHRYFHCCRDATEGWKTHGLQFYIVLHTKNIQGHHHTTQSHTTHSPQCEDSHLHLKCCSIHQQWLIHRCSTHKHTNDHHRTHHTTSPSTQHSRQRQDSLRYLKCRPIHEHSSTHRCSAHTQTRKRCTSHNFSFKHNTHPNGKRASNTWNATQSINIRQCTISLHTIRHTTITHETSHNFSFTQHSRQWKDSFRHLKCCSILQHSLMHHSTTHKQTKNHHHATTSHNFSFKHNTHANGKIASDTWNAAQSINIRQCIVDLHTNTQETIRHITQFLLHTLTRMSRPPPTLEIPLNPSTFVNAPLPYKQTRNITRYITQFLLQTQHSIHQHSLMHRCSTHTFLPTNASKEHNTTTHNTHPNPYISSNAPQSA